MAAIFANALFPASLVSNNISRRKLCSKCVLHWFSWKRTGGVWSSTHDLSTIGRSILSSPASWVDFYTKDGKLSAYASQLVLIPDYGVGFTVLAAGFSKIRCTCGTYR
jgi:hypothetical protein